MSAVGGNVDCLPEQANGAMLRARIALGMLQRDLVHDGCTRASVALIETGQRRLRRSHARAFVSVFRASLAKRPSMAAEEATAELERLLACRWARVASVASAPATTTHVYDLSVDGSETFLAGFGGLIVTTPFDRKSDREGQPAHARPGPQQDPGRPALRRVPRLLPEQRRRVLRQLLRLLPAGGVPAPVGHVHREGLEPQRGDRQAPSRGDEGALRAARRDHRGLGELHLRPRRAGRLRGHGPASQARRGLPPRHRPAPPRGPPVPAQRPGPPALAVPRPGRHAGAGARRRRTACVRVEFFGDEVERITELDPLTGELLAERNGGQRLPGQPLRDPGRQAAGGDRHDRGRGRGARRLAGGAGPGARGGAPPPAHDVRPRDDPRARASARGSRTTRATSPAGSPDRARGRCSTTSRRTGCSSSTSRT